jgi:DDE superfamily endonuclease
VWARRGTRPRAPRDRRYAWAYLFGAVCPERAIGAGLVLPYADATATGLHLAEISHHVASGAHGVVVLDRAGWHAAGDLAVPDNLTLLPLPSHSPELVWGFACQALTVTAPPSSAACSRSRTGDDDQRGACLGARGVAPQPCIRSARDEAGP